MRGVGVLKTHCFFLLSRAMPPRPLASGDERRPVRLSLESGRSVVVRHPGSGGTPGNDFGSKVYIEGGTPPSFP